MRLLQVIQHNNEVNELLFSSGNNNNYTHGRIQHFQYGPRQS